MLQAISSVQAENCLVKKLPLKVETCAMKSDSFISSKAQKGILMRPPEAKIKSFTGSNSFAPHEAIASGRGPTHTGKMRVTLQIPTEPSKKGLEFDKNIKKSSWYKW